MQPAHTSHASRHSKKGRQIILSINHSGDSRTLRSRSQIAQVASVLSKVYLNYREPLVYAEDGGEPRVRYNKVELAVLQAEFEECGECGWEGLRPVNDYPLGALFGKMTGLQTIMRHPDDLTGVLALENELSQQVWFHRQRQNGFVTVTEAEARRIVWEQTGRDDIDLEPRSRYRFGVLMGSLWAVKWALGQEWDQIAS